MTTQNDIENVLWSACDTFRGKIDSSRYKDYILSMLFVKYLSDVYKETKENYLKQYEGDMARVERAMRRERFTMSDTSTFDYLYENRFYRWFFILDEGKITRVFYTDGCNQIDVTEDVANIEYICWKDLNRLPFWNADVCKDKKQY